MKLKLKLILVIIALSCFILGSPFQLEIPKKLWVYWDSNLANAPKLVQLGFSKMKSVCAK